MKLLQHQGFITAGFTFLFIMCLWNSCDSMTETIKIWLLDAHIGMGNWAVYHGTVACSIGLIPFTSYLLFRFGKFKRRMIWVGFALGMVAITLFLVVLIARNYLEPYPYLMGNTSHRISIPFERYWDYALPASSMISAFVFLVIAYVHRSRSLKRVSKEVLD